MSFEIHREPLVCAAEELWSDTVLSRPDLKQPFIDALSDRMEKAGMVVGDDLNWLRLCLEETVVNAMVHGNEGDPLLPVSVSLYRDAADWILVVRDQGVGFDATEVPDPEDPDALLFEHGRGILLMNGWLDELAFYDAGATAYLRRVYSVIPS